MTKATTKTTLRIESDIYDSLKQLAADEGVSVSAIVNKALRNQLNEDMADINAFIARKNEKSTPMEAFMAQLKRDGKI